ncbi:MAG: asparagine synthase (glutamine-hydrolyzing) [Acidobacteriota bacterium]
MCGIAGIVGEGASPERALSMVSLMAYRGPDSRNVWAEPGVALASCRLAIVDLPGSDQPIQSEDGRYVLVFNGEIYNFHELRGELERAGRRFHTSGDAETVIAAHETWGDAYLEHLEGMFAFALWDRRERVLRLARDRFGEKPLAYTHDGTRLAFASELKALLAAGMLRGEADPGAIAHYLSLRAIPSPLTLFKDARQVPPASELVLRDGTVTVRRYWELAWRPAPPRSEREWAEALREHLRRAVKSRLVSDVPLGALLSGGLDSTAVVALMAENAPAPPRTFFIGFDAGERTKIDARYARLAAERLGTEHHELQMTSRGLVEDLPKILWHLESPSVDGYQYFYAYRLARERVTVALSGQGGDELFAGYGWFHQIQLLESWRRRLSSFAPRGGGRMVARFLRSLGKPRPASRVDAMLSGESLCDSYVAIKHLYPDADKDRLYTAAFRERLTGAPPSRAVIADELSRMPGWPATEAISRLQIATDLANILLRDTDAVSMASSLEVRLPLLDHRLVEFGLSIPSELKHRGGEGKHILRAALDGIVPREVLERPKLGFSFPMAAWLKGPLRPLADAAFSPEVIRRRGAFEPEAMRRVYRLFYEGRGSRSPFYVWCFTLLEAWHRIFVDSGGAMPARLSDLLDAHPA